MHPETTPEEAALFNDVSRLAAALWAKSETIEGLNTDRKMISVILFQRLWGNHRGYTLLRNQGLHLEAEIVLRSAIETAICIAANFELRHEFVALLRRDAAHTLQGQIKLERANADALAVSEAEHALREVTEGLPPGVGAARLQWERLATQSRVPHLYDWHRRLSGLSSHVTGFSILRNVMSDDVEELQHEVRALTRKLHLMMLAGSTAQASITHATMIGDEAARMTGSDLMTRLGSLSGSWPKR